MAAQTSYTDTPPIGRAGMLANCTPYRARTGINEESVAVIPPGVFCRRGTDPRQVKLPTLAIHITTQAFARGFALRSSVHVNPFAVTSVNAEAWQPLEPLPVCEMGDIYTLPETAFVAGGKVFVRFISRVGFTQLGAVRNSVDSFDPGGGAVDHAVAMQFAEFMNTGSIGDVAIVKFNVLPAS